MKTIEFPATETNVGPCTIQERDHKAVTLHKDGAPLKAGDLKRGQTVTFERSTGRVMDRRELL